MFFFAVAISVMVILCILAALPRPRKVQNYIELTPWELLQRETFLRACEGNKAARDWTIENTLRSQKSGAVVLDTAEPVCYTPSAVTNDAISALVSLGHTKMNAQITVQKLVANKSFKTSQQIIVEAMKRK